MSRAILVLGTGRSGTSALAGCLYHLGVWMGDEFVRRDHRNPWGTYEDKELYFLTRQVWSGAQPPEAYAEPLALRAERDLWGWKDPGLVWTLHHARPYLPEDTRIVVAQRPPGQCIDSARRAYDWQLDVAQEWHQANHERLVEVLESWDGPLMRVEFSGLLEETETVVNALDGFVESGADDEQLALAIRSVRR